MCKRPWYKDFYVTPYCRTIMGFQVRRVHKCFGDHDVTFPLAQAFLFVDLLATSLPFFNEDASPFTFALLQDQVVGKGRYFLLRMSYRVGAVLRRVVRRVDLRIGRFLRLLRNVPRLLLRLFVVEDCHAHRRHVRQLRLLLGVDNNEICTPLRDQINYVILHDVGRTNVLSARLLNCFHRFIIGAFRFLLANYRLLKGRLMRIFICRPRVPPRDLLRKLRVRRTQRRFRRVNLLRKARTFLIQLISPYLRHRNVCYVIASGNLYEGQNARRRSLRYLTTTRDRVNLPVHGKNANVGRNAFGHRSLTFIGNGHPHRLRQVLPRYSFGVFYGLLNFLVGRMFNVHPLFLLGWRNDITSLATRFGSVYQRNYRLSGRTVMMAILAKNIILRGRCLNATFRFRCFVHKVKVFKGLSIGLNAGNVQTSQGLFRLVIVGPLNLVVINRRTSMSFFFV